MGGMVDQVEAQGERKKNGKIKRSIRNKPCDTHEAVNLWLIPKFPSNYPDPGSLSNVKMPYFMRGTMISSLPRAHLSSSLN